MSAYVNGYSTFILPTQYTILYQTFNIIGIWYIFDEWVTDVLNLIHPQPVCLQCSVYSSATFYSIKWNKNSITCLLCTYTQKNSQLISHAHVRVNIFLYPLIIFFFHSFFRYIHSHSLDIFYVSHILSWTFLAFRVAKNKTTQKKIRIFNIKKM